MAKLIFAVLSIFTAMFLTSGQALAARDADLGLKVREIPCTLDQVYSGPNNSFQVNPNGCVPGVENKSFNSAQESYTYFSREFEPKTTEGEQLINKLLNIMPIEKLADVFYAQSPLFTILVLLAAMYVLIFAYFIRSLIRKNKSG